MTDSKGLMKPTVKLQNWKLRAYGRSLRLVGNVLNHPSQPDGLLFETSRVLNINFEGHIAETANSFYELISEGSDL